jgi:hypothetical protein
VNEKTSKELLSSLRQQARKLSSVCALVILAAAVSFGLAEESWLLFMLTLLFLWPPLLFVVKGHNWARLLLIFESTCLGVTGLAIGFVEFVISFGRIEALPYLTAPLFLLSLAAILYASDTLVEWCEVHRLGVRVFDWKSIEKHRIDPDPGRSARLLNQAEIRRRRRLGELTSKLVTVLTLVTWILFLVFTAVLWIEGSASMAELATDLQQANSWIAVMIYMMLFIAFAAIIPAYVVTSYLIVFFLPFIIASPICIPLALAWKYPSRFLLLRPFNRLDASKALKRILRTEISAFGHCYTLADVDVRVSLWQRLPLLYGQLTFFTFRQRKISSPRHLTKLLKSIHARRRRNLNWAVSRDKIFPVACVDAGWQSCVTNLVEDSDCIIMDLSGMSENIQWELDFLQTSGALHKTVFVAQDDQLAIVANSLPNQFGSDFLPTVLGYNAEGLVKPGGLTDAVSAHLYQDLK